MTSFVSPIQHEGGRQPAGIEISSGCSTTVLQWPQALSQFVPSSVREWRKMMQTNDHLRKMK